MADHERANHDAANYFAHSIAAGEQPPELGGDPAHRNLATAYLEDHAEVERLRGEVAKLMETMGVVTGNARASEAEAKRIADGAYVTQETMEEILASSRETHAENERLREALGRAEAERERLTQEWYEEARQQVETASSERDAALQRAEAAELERDEMRSALSDAVHWVYCVSVDETYCEEDKDGAAGTLSHMEALLAKGENDDG